MNLEDVTLSESARYKWTNVIQFHFYELPRGVRFKEIESRRMEEGWNGDCLKGTDFLFHKIKRIMGLFPFNGLTYLYKI